MGNGVGCHIDMLIIYIYIYSFGFESNLMDMYVLSICFKNDSLWIWLEDDLKMANKWSLKHVDG